MRKGQLGVAVVSTAVGVCALGLWEFYYWTGRQVPLYVWVMAAYGWTFVAFWGIDRWARRMSRNRGGRHRADSRKTGPGDRESG